jgi:hypothetical protein
MTNIQPYQYWFKSGMTKFLFCIKSVDSIKKDQIICTCDIFVKTRILGPYFSFHKTDVIEVKKDEFKDWKMLGDWVDMRIV